MVSMKESFQKRIGNCHIRNDRKREYHIIVSTMSIFIYYFEVLSVVLECMAMLIKKHGRDIGVDGIILELKVDYMPEDGIRQIKEKSYVPLFQGKLGEECKYV